MSQRHADNQHKLLFTRQKTHVPPFQRRFTDRHPGKSPKVASELGPRMSMPNKHGRGDIAAAQQLRKDSTKLYMPTNMPPSEYRPSVKSKASATNITSASLGRSSQNFMAPPASIQEANQHMYPAAPLHFMQHRPSAASQSKPTKEQRRYQVKPQKRIDDRTRVEASLNRAMQDDSSSDRI